MVESWSDGIWSDSGNSIKVAPTGFPEIGEKVSPRTERREERDREERLPVWQYGAEDRDGFSLERVNFALSTVV